MSMEGIKIDESKLDDYVLAAKDACFYAGLAHFCSNNKCDENFDDATFTPFTLLPCPFPRLQYEYAFEIQPYWNQLLHYASNDKQLLNDCFKEVIKYDKFVEKIWNIYDIVSQEETQQKYTLAVNRIDYMLDKNKMMNNCDIQLSQIEINTYSCGCTAIPTKMHNLHKYMLQKTDRNEYTDQLLPTDVLQVIVGALVEAWKLYDNQKSHIALIVQNKKYNYSDHRLLEYEIMPLLPKTKFIRVTLSDVFARGRLNEDKRLFIDNDEIALVYYKSGFDPIHYPSDKVKVVQNNSHKNQLLYIASFKEWDARLMIERSRAIKAPNVQYHLCCTKMFQQYLTEPGVMEKLIKEADVIRLLKATFVRQYKFQNNEEKFIEIILNDSDNYILKPQREGGGNNIYANDVKKFYLELSDKTQLNSYILVEKIPFVYHENYIVRPKAETRKEQVLTELGVFGVLLGCSNNKIVFNRAAGYSNVTKCVTSNESSMLIGFGGYDSIYLTN